ncbi:MAG: hypothetical protein QF664_10335 [Dehalococcoidia bacterium]|jgi:hypothetical protein|nr:hypothetical protein [Dehalococcoidia bacterium]
MAPAHYRFPPWFVLRWLTGAAAGRHRDIVSDAEHLLRRFGPTPTLEGAGELPTAGPYILVINHYERPGMRMWWTVLVATLLISRRVRSERIRWLSTNRFQGWSPYGVTVVPGVVVRWFLGLVGRTYELLLVDPDSALERSGTIREAYRTLHRDRRPIGLAPEAGNAPGLARELIEAVPRSGAVIAWLARGEVPVIPLAIWEDDGCLRARVGPPYVLERPGAALAERDHEALTARVMGSVAALMPPELRGAYREAP